MPIQCEALAYLNGQLFKYSECVEMLHFDGEPVPAPLVCAIDQSYRMRSVQPAQNSRLRDTERHRGAQAI